MTGASYIGSSVHTSRRWSVHQAYLRRGCHQNARLQRSWNKHGSAAFRFEVVEQVSVENLIAREQAWIDHAQLEGRPIYNARLTAHSNLGVRHTAASRLKMSVLAKERGVSEATRKAQKLAVTGRPTSDLQKQRASETHSGRQFSSDSRQKMREAALDRPESHRQAIRQALLKSWIVITPEGDEIAVENMKAFAAEHGLMADKLYAVARGARNHHKGWRARQA